MQLDRGYAVKNILLRYKHTAYYHEQIVQIASSVKGNYAVAHELYSDKRYRQRGVTAKRTKLVYKRYKQHNKQRKAHVPENAHQLRGFQNIRHREKVVQKIPKVVLINQVDIILNDKL